MLTRYRVESPEMAVFNTAASGLFCVNHMVAFSGASKRSPELPQNIFNVKDLENLRLPAYFEGRPACKTENE